MTSRRDLLEAQASLRRQLLHALLAGTPDGEQPEPTATGRWLLGGVVVGAVAALVVAALTLLGVGP